MYMPTRRGIAYAYLHDDDLPRRVGRWGVVKLPRPLSTLFIISSFHHRQERDADKEGMMCSWGIPRRGIVQ